MSSCKGEIQFAVFLMLRGDPDPELIFGAPVRALDIIHESSARNYAVTLTTNKDYYKVVSDQ
jgi:hypothetical protein